MYGGVVHGHTVLPCTLVFQRSLAVLRPSQALHYDLIWVSVEYLCRDFSNSGVQDMYVVCIEAGSRRGILNTRRRDL